jgi:hypothetical protein
VLACILEGVPTYGELFVGLTVPATYLVELTVGFALETVEVADLFTVFVFDARVA